MKTGVKNSKLAKKPKKVVTPSYVDLKHIISLILQEENLKNIYNLVISYLEANISKSRISILTVNRSKGINTFEFGSASMSFHPDFINLISNLKVDISSGACGAAVVHKTSIIVKDVMKNALTMKHEDLLVENSVRSIWSIPIVSKVGEVYGVIGIYFSTTHTPTKKELKLIDELVNVLVLAIERAKFNLDKKDKEAEIERQKIVALNSLKFASLNEMAGNIAHEINGPLAILLGSLHHINRIIAKDEVDIDKLRTHHERINRTVKRIERIVRGLKSVTNDSSKEEFVKTPINEIIEDVLSITHERLAGNGINLKFTGEIDQELECHPSQLSQVILNLINNSYDAVVNQENPWIQINVENLVSYIRIDIIDSGNGIKESVAERMMIPLFTTKNEGKVSGLGLSISKTIIEEHNGHFWYDESTTHTTFVIELPKSQRKAARKNLELEDFSTEQNLLKKAA